MHTRPDRRQRWRHYVKIVLGDFNDKEGKEGIFGQAIGKFSLHDVSSNNGLRLIDFVMAIGTIKFQHLNIHKATWLLPDQNTRNQIGCTNALSIQDVCNMLGTNIESGHYHVVAKVRTPWRRVWHPYLLTYLLTYLAITTCYRSYVMSCCSLAPISDTLRS